jgi:hypothetical protein
MRSKWVAKNLTVLASAFSSLWAAAQIPKSPVPHWDLVRTLNQEAEATDAEGIRKYGKHVIELVVPERAGKAYIDSLSDRLAQTEEKARVEKKELIPEANIARAFNDLMKQIGAPDSLRTDEGTVRRLRVGQLAISPVPALITVNRNERMCNPGEAVYLLYLLILNNGTIPSALPEGMKASDLPRIRISSRPAALGDAFQLLSRYSSQRSRTDTLRVFDNVVQTLGF